MPDHSSLLPALRRPRLLIRAARFGLGDYNRTRDLVRLLRQPELPSPRAALAWLIEEETVLEERRRSGGAGYSPARHVEVLIALMAEARIAAHGEPEPPAQTNASGIAALRSATNATSASRVAGSSGGAS